ncbi:MAG: type IV pilus secretin PilQ [Neisseriaceae bacterium]|nr:type IV pilus secretin PilQ [Neisseriaceae bacterium]
MMKKVTVKVLSGLGLSVLMVSAWAEPVQNANAPLTQQQVSRRVVSNVTNVEMNFNKGRNNAGIMSFSLPAKHGTPKIERTRNELILTFSDMALAANAQRSYDVSEFGTPVRNVSLQRLGNDTKITIANGAAWDYSVKDNGSQYVVTVSNQAALFNALDERPKPKSFKGGRVTLDFQDVDVRTILQIIAKESGQNIVASDSVQGKMTLNLKDVPWDQALDLVMQARNLDMRQHGNVWRIAPRNELLNQERDQMKGQRELSELGPLLSRTFQLKYKSVEEFKTLLESTTTGNSGSSGGNSNSILTSRGSAMFDTGTNTMIITDTQPVITKFERLVAQLDVPVRQVMIEARIVEANEGFSRELGVKWQAGSVDNAGHADTGVGGGHSIKGFDNGDTLTWGPSYSTAQGPNGTQIDLRNWGNPNVYLPASAATSAITLFRSTAHGFLGLELSAMQENNKGKIVSSPRVLTQDRKEASLSEGLEVPYEVATSSGATSIQFKDAVTGLKVTPQITPDGNVIMTLKVSKNTVDRYLNNGTAVLSKKEVETSAMVENGGTMVVGGIYVEENTNDAGKVPLLGDIPVLGNLFKHTTKKKARRELLVFITPRIIDTMNTSSLNY